MDFFEDVSILNASLIFGTSQLDGDDAHACRDVDVAIYDATEKRTLLSVVAMAIYFSCTKNIRTTNMHSKMTAALGSVVESPHSARFKQAWPS